MIRRRKTGFLFGRRNPARHCSMRACLSGTLWCPRTSALPRRPRQHQRPRRRRSLGQACPSAATTLAPCLHRRRYGMRWAVDDTTPTSAGQSNCHLSVMRLLPLGWRPTGDSPAACRECPAHGIINNQCNSSTNYKKNKQVIIIIKQKLSAQINRKKTSQNLMRHADAATEKMVSAYVNINVFSSFYSASA